MTFTMKRVRQMDQIDRQIIELLEENSRLTNKQIGDQVHMTGQAVGSRINQLIDTGVINHFTIRKSYQSTQFIRIFLNGVYFDQIKQITMDFDYIEQFYKVSGEACFIVLAHFDNKELDQYLEKISNYVRYTVENTVGENLV